MRTRTFLLPLFFLFSLTVMAQENCNNGIDDDGDGKIDLNDSDCICAATANVPSIVPNPSFEVKTGCPTNFSQLNLATPWIQATFATTDYFNTCGFIMPAIINAGLQNFPDGGGIAGALYLRDWNEYLGAPLSAPMTAGTPYQLTFDIGGLMTHNDGSISSTPISSIEPVNVTLYGCALGTNLPLDIESNPSDADNTWVEIGHATYTPVSQWGKITMAFTAPFNVNAIMLGPPKVLPATYPEGGNSTDFPYFVYDNLLLNLASAFGVNIAQTGNFCDNNLILSANLTINMPPTVTYQWYRNGIAIVGATGPAYSIAGLPANLGKYSVKIENGSTCYISTSLTVTNTTPAPAISVLQPTCIVLTGTITVTTPAAQYSFDNGATWQASPVSPALPIGNYYIKTKTVNGCISSPSGVHLSAPQLLQGSNFTVVQPTTCNGTGSITINSSIAVAYSFDDGLAWGTSNTAANLPPGDYYIKIKDAAGCQSGAQMVILNRIFLQAPAYTAVNPFCSAGGSITITTLASQYSFDDGATWQTNNVLSNIPADYYTIKIKDASGCESSPNYVYLYDQLPPAPGFTSVEPTCQQMGSITITTASPQYSFDGGITWTTNNTMGNLSPGYYELSVRDATGCASDIKYVYFYQPYLLTPQITVTHPFCTETTGVITITASANYTYSFDGGVSFQASNVSPPLLPGSYVVVVKSSTGCESQGAYVYISNPTGIPDPPTGNSAQLFCVYNNPTLKFLVVQGENICWYASLTSTIELNPSTPLVNGASYFATQTGANGCESQQRFEVSVSVINYPIPVSDYATLICDDLNDGHESSDFADYNDLIIANSANYDFEYYNSFAGAENAIAPDRISNSGNFTLTIGEKTIYVRVIAANGCWRVAELKLTLIPSPFNTMKTDYILCENGVVRLVADAGFNSYLWSTGQTIPRITVYEPGNYWVTVTENHGSLVCSTTTNLKVAFSNPATVLSIETTDWTERENSITILLDTSSAGDYEYSLDGINYQTGNAFTGLLCGEYTVYIHDKHGCGLTKEEVFLLTYPKFFTPNDDGYNDAWHIKFSDIEKGLDVKIFDRFGKFLKQLKYNGPGWDGTYNGQQQPSDDYWFVVTRQDGREYRGHFALKR